MRKILMALNAQKIKTPAVDFGCYIAKLTNSPLKGILLEHVHKHQLSNVLAPAGDDEYETKLPLDIVTKANIFCDRCVRNGARHSLRHVTGNPLQQMIKESLYADIIITDGDISFGESDGWPSTFATELLQHAKCPVLVAPFYFNDISEIIFAYDGIDSSVFAIKQFIYLFPELADVKISVLQVVKNENENITEKEKLQDLLMMHYGAVHYDATCGYVETELLEKLLSKPNSLLVMGAYGRKIFFKQSTADILLKTTNAPIFITHY